jgi:ribonuclease P protein component
MAEKLSCLCGLAAHPIQLSTFQPLSLFPVRFRPEQHLRRQADFRNLRTQGRRIDGGAFTLWWRSRETAGQVAALPVRVGVVASIASVGPAVRRNAAKRRLREIFRRHQTLVPPGTDLLLVARSALNRLEFGEIEAKFVDVCRRITGDKA